MKMISVFIITLLSIQSFAADAILMEKRYSNPSKPGNPVHQAVQITASGVVQQVKYEYGNTKVTHIANLSSKVVDRLKAEIESLKETNLSGPGPKCTEEEADLMQNSIVYRNQKPITIKSEKFCAFEDVSGMGTAASLIYVMNSISALGNDVVYILNN